MSRADLGASPAARLACREALGAAHVSVNDIALFDLYSCFPIAVFNVCDGLGLSPQDPRGLTVTGGLPYFGSGNVVSQSNVDNIEHVFVRDLEAGDYVLQLERADGLGASWDAGVAWLFPQPPLAGDLNGDEIVDIDDLFQLLGAWGACKACPEDLDGNGAVDIDDLFTLLGNWT